MLAALGLVVLLDSVLPHPERRWERWLRAIVNVGRHRSDPKPDPFEVLRVQDRLAAVSRQPHDLEADEDAYARVHRLAAVRAAYDDLLVEACRLSGVPPKPAGPRDDAARWQEEQALVERGWTW